jgi:hypothetical protein
MDLWSVVEVSLKADFCFSRTELGRGRTWRSIVENSLSRKAMSGATNLDSSPDSRFIRRTRMALDCCRQLFRRRRAVRDVEFSRCSVPRPAVQPRVLSLPEINLPEREWLVGRRDILVASGGVRSRWAVWFESSPYPNFRCLARLFPGPPRSLRRHLSIQNQGSAEFHTASDVTNLASSPIARPASPERGRIRLNDRLQAKGKC